MGFGTVTLGRGFECNRLTTPIISMSPTNGASYGYRSVMKLMRLCATLLVGTAMLSLASTAQTRNAATSPELQPKESKSPRPGAFIVEYCVAEAATNSGYESGPLQIVYSDESRFVEALPPKKEGARNQEGISYPQLAEDRQTIGWLEDYDNCCTSYAISLSLVVFRSGSIIQRIWPGQMIWQWMFFDDGKYVGVISGPTHGTDIGEYKLYSVKTGRLVAEANTNAQLPALKADAPAWAKKLDQKLDQPSRADVTPPCKN